MTSIFISYRRGDSGGHAGRLFDRLRCWFNEDDLFFDVNSIDWGKDFPEEIEQAIRNARAVLVVIGPDWLKTINERADIPKIDFVRREMSIAIQRRAAGEVEVFPILVGSTAMPDASRLHDELKEEIGKLFDYSAHELPDDVKLWDYQFDRLLQCIAHVKGVPLPYGQFSQGEGSFIPRINSGEPTRLPALIDVQAVQQVFGSVSTALLNWPQEIDGQWIERPELAQLHEITTRSQSTVTVLLGEPGGGKSAVLARLGARLSREGAVLLAIKADQLPRSTSTLRDLEDWLGCEIPVTETLRRLAEEHRVIVLIDQLDALSDLMDQHSERLGSLIRFVDSICGLPNHNVIVSCREFEFHNDVRFNSLNAEEITIARLTWEQVEPLLAARGFETSGWSNEVRDVLRTPQHLAMFITHLADNEGVPLFTNYQGLLAHIVKERLENVHGSRTVEAAESIAATMAVEEELWLGRGRFEREFGSELRCLESAGFMIKANSGLSIAFRHQTVFDFLRARGFLRNGQPLVKYIVEMKQQSLFVRPILWSTLNYLRASDKTIYREQFGSLWKRQNLRPHIRYLLVDFLGQLADPDDQEAQWLFPLLEEEALRSRILHATAGSPGWFARLGSRIPVLMTAEPEKTWEITTILKKATSFEPNTVHEAVKRFWMTDGGYLTCALAVMREFSSWDDSTVDTVCKLAGHAPDDTFLIQNIIKKISESTSDLAPKVLAHYLQAKTRKIDAGRTGNELWSYERLIENNSSWHGIEDIARRAPKAFLQEIWPWLVELFSRLGRKEIPHLYRYRDHHGLSFMRKTSERQPMQTAIEDAIRNFAETETEDFLDFLERNKESDMEVLHRLLSLGLEKIAKLCPREVLRYLLEDPRRFAIRDKFSKHGDSQALISAMVPSLQKDEALRLEEAIREWTGYRETPKGEDATAKRDRLKWIRQSRLRLLRVFPFEQLTPSGQQYVKEEERALPETHNEDWSVSGGMISSPMSSEQMEMATDCQILALFEELTDDTEWNHPRRRWKDNVGGSIQASREFAKFARNAPHRALRLIRRFQAGKMERPAGTALAELAKDFTEPDALILCIHELDASGFVSEVFRGDAARCLGEIARRSKGLDDETCKLLEKWITDWMPESDVKTMDDTGNSSGNITGREIPEEERQKSLLWDHWGIRILPRGNYPFLNALMRGYLFRKPFAVDQWLAVLERHLARNENPIVWQEVAEDLWRLRKANRVRANKFLESLFSLYPNILHTITGVSLVAQVMPWLSEWLIDSIVKDWISGIWQEGPQAAGEILGLKHCRNPNDESAKILIEKILSGDGFKSSVVDELRLGITYTFVTAWSEPALRALTTPYLVQLAAMESMAVEMALSKSFSKVDLLPADNHTRDFLEALLDRPCVLVGGGHSLIEGLKALLRDGWNPKLVYRVINALITEKAKDLGNISTSWASHAGALADIALTLHRIPDTRELGLELFERLMEARSYGIEERILAIDRPAFR